MPARRHFTICSSQRKFRTNFISIPAGTTGYYFAEHFPASLEFHSRAFGLDPARKMNCPRPACAAGNSRPESLLRGRNCGYNGALSKLRRDFDLLTIQAIRDARERIRDSIYLSPFVRSETFSQLTGNSIFFKLENLQMTGAFKERGALNKILLLTDEERRRGVIAASAGNHAQAVAYHATKRGIAAEICMPLTTPITKVSATRGYGAEVVLVGANYDEACQEAVRRCHERNLTFIHPFDDEAVIAGQGTIGLEMLEVYSDLDAVVIPVGGGGLIAGVACALKETTRKSR